MLVLNDGKTIILEHIMERYSTDWFPELEHVISVNSDNSVIVRKHNPEKFSFSMSNQTFPVGKIVDDKK